MDLHEVFDILSNFRMKPSWLRKTSFFAEMDIENSLAFTNFTLTNDKVFKMKALTYTAPGRFELIEKPKPEIVESKDAVVKVTLASICSSDLHILHGAVPLANVGITVGHELVGLVEAVGSEVTKVKPGDRVAVNVETFCGECFYCKRGCEAV